MPCIGIYRMLKRNNNWELDMTMPHV